MKHAVFLVPGFFGFSTLGNINYFSHVEQALKRRFEAANHELDVFAVPTLPTASIRKRARILARIIQESQPQRFGRIHILGHSTGGLDGRLLVSPGVSLGPEEDQVGKVVNTLVTLATPNYGTPIAGFFTNLAGKHMLLATSLVMILSMKGVGRTGYTWAGRALSYLTRLDDVLGLDNTLLDYLTEHLLSDLSRERQEEITRFMHNIAEDQGALLQVSAEGMDIFNAAVVDNPDVQYLSYVTGAPRPSALVYLKGLRDPYFAPSYSLFQVLYRLTGRASAIYPYPPFPKQFAKRAQDVWGFVPGKRDNDGVVPTCSQVWGELAGMVAGDHLDVCGHFFHKDLVESHTDWLRSGAGFGLDVFDALYDNIAQRLMGESPDDHRVPGTAFLEPGGAGGR